MNIPLLDLTEQYSRIKDEIKSAVNGVLDSQRFILGDKVSELEDLISAYCGTGYAAGVSSGTDAIIIGLMALGIGPGDSVITTPFTFFATAGAVTRLGARPVFADIDPQTYNINPDKIEGLLKRDKSIKAVIPVHLFGQSADMDPVLSAAKEFSICIIEDAAQAIGARYKDKPAGGIGDLGCFSFFPSKNLGAYGDAGMVVTNNGELAEKIKKLRVHGAERKYFHSMIGGNFRLDAIQAAVLIVKLKYLDEWTRKRQENARRYNKMFEGMAMKLPYTSPFNVHVFNQYVIRVPDRDNLKKFLTEKGITTEVYYPVPLHLQECFKYLGYKKGDFPESEKAAEEVLALPVYPEIKAEQQEYIVGRIREFYNAG